MTQPAGTSVQQAIEQRVDFGGRVGDEADDRSRLRSELRDRHVTIRQQADVSPVAQAGRSDPRNFVERSVADVDLAAGRISPRQQACRVEEDTRRGVGHDGDPPRLGVVGARCGHAEAQRLLDWRVAIAEHRQRPISVVSQPVYRVAHALSPFTTR